MFGAPPKPEAIERYAKAGVERVALWVPPAGKDVALPILDGHAKLMRTLGA